MLRTFEVALIPAVSTESGRVGQTTFHAHYGLPALLAVADVLSQIVVKFGESHCSGHARSVYIEPDFFKKIITCLRICRTIKR